MWEFRPSSRISYRAKSGKSTFFSFSVFVLHYNRGSKSRVQNRKFRFRFSYSTRTDLRSIHTVGRNTKYKIEKHRNPPGPFARSASPPVTQTFPRFVWTFRYHYFDQFYVRVNRRSSRSSHYEATWYHSLDIWYRKLYQSDEARYLYTRLLNWQATLSEIARRSISAISAIFLRHINFGAWETMMDRL